MPRCVPRCMDTSERNIPQGEHIIVLNSCCREWMLRRIKTGLIALFLLLNFFYWKAFAEKNLFHGLPSAGGKLLTEIIIINGIHENRNASHRQFFCESAVISVKMGEKKLCMGKIHLQLIKSVKKCLLTFRAVKAGVNDQCFAVGNKNIAVEIFQWVVRERDINPVNIRGVIKLFDHKGPPFLYMRCVIIRNTGIGIAAIEAASI